ncbi:MAG TPA: tail-specific protease, partial [Flavobacterium sp.]
MKRNYKILLVVAALCVAFWSFMPRGVKTDPEKDKLLIELLAFVIEKGHYDPAAIDDNFSKGAYKDYIQALDPSKRFFLQADIDEFVKYELKIDDQIKEKDLAFFDLTYNRLMQRIKESRNYYKDVLAKPFDYNVEEQFDTNYEKLPYAKTIPELKEKWRKQIKLSTLSSLTDKMELQEGKKKSDVSAESSKSVDKSVDKVTGEVQKPADKTDKKEEVNIKPKTFAELEKETRESSLKSLDEYFSFIDDLNRDDWFSVYINAIASR